MIRFCKKQTKWDKSNTFPHQLLTRQEMAQSGADEHLLCGERKFKKGTCIVRQEKP